MIYDSVHHYVQVLHLKAVLLVCDSISMDIYSVTSLSRDYYLESASFIDSISMIYTVVHTMLYKGNTLFSASVYMDSDLLWIYTVYTLCRDYYLESASSNKRIGDIDRESLRRVHWAVHVVCALQGKYIVNPWRYQQGKYIVYHGRHVVRALQGKYIVYHGCTRIDLLGKYIVYHGRYQGVKCR